ncbi:MAG: glycosyl transferase family 1 [Rhodospirillaceae bacterium]|nr:glycosyl transferase family 1 [Rhodospirillaceae bacterium]
MLPIRIAWRDLRGGYKNFKIFFACLVLGVGTIAGIGSTSSSIFAGLEAESRNLLGGDIALRVAHRPINSVQYNWIMDRAEISRVTSMRSMVHNKNTKTRTLINLKSVDSYYPLFGSLSLNRNGRLKDFLKRKDGIWGAIAEQPILERLKAKIGDIVRIGNAFYRLNAVLVSEPDSIGGIRAITRGPRLMISAKSLNSTGLIQPGTQISYHYRLRLPKNYSLKEFKNALSKEFPNAGWRMRDRNTAAPSTEQFINYTAQFLTLVGLTALLIGGVGAGNAIRGYLDGKMRIIATLKCIGAEKRLIFITWLLEIAIMTLGAITIGLVLGCAAPALISKGLSGLLTVPLKLGVYPGPLLIAAAYGILVAVLFSMLPLARACSVKPGNLFRDHIIPIKVGFNLPIYCVTILSLIALVLLAIFTSHDIKIASGFIAGTAAAFLLFFGAGHIIIKFYRIVGTVKNARLRLALANLNRPGSQTANIVLSMGLGLTVLIAVVVVESNIKRQITETMPSTAPGFYFIDIQPHQISAFKQIVQQTRPIKKIIEVPMLRGRITHVKGVPASKVKSASNTAWVLRSDRGLTWNRHPPEGAKIIDGSWWNQDYEGPPLVSFDAGAAKGIGVGIGDKITVNILGRPITATIANLRAVDWKSLRVNFVMVFSPGVITNAPQTHIAAIHLDPKYENAVENAVTEKFSNISAVRVRYVLQAVSSLMGRIAGAIQITALVTILAGTMVLAGAIAAGQQRRIIDSVVLKVLGARKRDIVLTMLIEFIFIAFLTVLIAAVLGTLAGWAVISTIMKAEWIPIFDVVLLTTFGATIFMVSISVLGTWRALAQKPAAILRNE